MGMRSTFLEQEIKALNKKALKQIKREDCEDSVVISEKGDIDFEGWDDWKIEGYWYDSTISFLKSISSFIEGWAEFEYEEGYRFRILFEKGKAYFQKQPQIDWSKAYKDELKFEVRK
ncbi:unnamed protein product [marine sediment metagenome]|uniref:Uncharacterized protein n=1 Tax=marine sediment metagenome TaxID=412755 RepID=X0X567_9ZZZZ